MRLYSLSSHLNKPCNVITFNSCTLMLDCGLDMTSAMHFLPLPLVPSQKLNNLNVWMPRDADSQLEGELKECMNRVFVDSPPEFKPPSPGLIDFSEIDAILVSNYFSIMALPFITNSTNFQGDVLLTEPTLQIGSLLMEELVLYIERTPKSKHSSKWKSYLRSLTSSLSEAKSPKTWKVAYSKKGITESISHAKIVAYNEKINICGVLHATAISSGFCIGSCNWIIQSDHEKISYMSSSSTLTTHPRPIDQNAMKSSDVLIITGLSHTPTCNPDAMLGEFCVAVAQTVRNGGCALVPCYPSGVVYDLFECLSNHLDNVNLPYIPMYFISPVADSSLAYSNIFAEWLSPAKQGKVYQMEDPFPHSHLIKTGRLKAFKNIHSEEFSSEFRQPCIVFCGHPSLRFGDSVHFLEMWANNPLNAVLFTEPDFDFVEALSPFQPLAIRPVTCPIDTSLNFTQAKKLISDLQPVKLIVPEVYMKPPQSASHRTDLCLNADDQQVLTFNENEVVSVKLQRNFEMAQVTPDLALSLNPVSIKPGFSATTFSAALSIQNNKCELKVIYDNDDNSLPSFYPYGTIVVDEFVQKLAQSGFADTKVEEDASGCLITLENESVMIQLKENSTHIISSNSKTRQKLRDILLSCLNSL